MTEAVFMALRNAETMTFFDRKVVEEEKLYLLDIRNVLKDDVFDQAKILKYIEQQVKEHNAKRLVIDSITAILYAIDDKAKIRQFIFQLSKVLSTLGCTTILTSEIPHEGGYSAYGVEEYISDGIISLTNKPGENKIIRKLQIIKMRGIGFRSGAIIFDITPEGLVLYPKIPINRKIASTEFNVRLKSGVPKFDNLVGGGFPQGHMIMITGNTGSGKSTFAMQFIHEGLEKGEPCLYVALEESSTQVKKTALSHGWDFEKYEKSGNLTFIDPDLIDLYPDKILSEILETVKKTKAKRIVIDSASSLESATMNKNNVREFLLQLTGICKSLGITCVMTYLTEEIFGGTSNQLLGSGSSSELRLSSVVDGIILLRYVERAQTVKKLLNVLKMRGSQHDKNIWEFTVDKSGMNIGSKFKR